MSRVSKIQARDARPEPFRPARTPKGKPKAAERPSIPSDAARAAMAAPHASPSLAAVEVVAIPNLTRKGQLFRCTRLAATITVHTCITRRAAKDGFRHTETTVAKYPSCNGCPDGAEVSAVISAARLTKRVKTAVVAHTKAVRT